jgi:outer membrane protein TolC
MMMKTQINNSVFIAMACFVLLPCSLFGQNNIQPLDLTTVMQLGGANNLVIQEHLKKQALEMANSKRAREWWLPDFYTGTTVHQLWGNAMNGDGKIFQDVNRQNLWAGLGMNVSWDFGTGIFKANAAELKVKASEFKSQAEKNRKILEIIHTYYDFLAAQFFYNAYDNLAAQSDTIAQQIGLQVTAGLRYESEFLLAQSNTSHLKIEVLSSKMTRDKLAANLTRLLNLDPSVTIIAVDSVLTPIQLEGSSDSISFVSAHEKRPEIQDLTLTLQSLEEEKKITSTALYLPELRVGTYASTFGDIFSPSNPTGAVNAALIWRLPVGRINNGGAVQQYDANIALQENQIHQAKAQINEELMRSSNIIQVAKQQIDVSISGKQMAEKALEQCVLRQQAGTVRPFEILQVQEVYIKSKLDYLQAVASYNKAQYALFVASGNNL